MKNQSIERQLSRNSTLLTGLVLTVSVVIINLTITDWLEDEFDENLAVKANVLVTLVKDSTHSVEFDFADEFMPEFEDLENPQYFQLWANEGKNIFEKSHSLNENDLPYASVQTKAPHLQDLILADGRKGRMIQINFTPQIPMPYNRTKENLAKQKQMTLVVARERESLDQLILLIHAFSIFGTVIILALINFLLRQAVRKGLQPLATIKEQIKLLKADNLKARLDIIYPPEELDDVIQQFNQLLERLEYSFERSKRFSSDVAHELRTPIAELRSMSEVALKWPEDTSLVTEFFTGVHDASEQMQLVVNNLLALARCENGDINLEPKEITLKNLIQESWSHYQNEADRKKISLDCEVQDDLKIMTSVTEFDQIIANLLSNAVSYSPENSVISIKVRNHSDSVRLVISNTAEQLEQEDLEIMFERLWRKSNARSSSVHSGLGLSLVKAYIDLIGLRISTDLSQYKQFSINIDGIHLV